MTDFSTMTDGQLNNLSNEQAEEYYAWMAEQSRAYLGPEAVAARTEKKRTDLEANLEVGDCFLGRDLYAMIYKAAIRITSITRQKSGKFIAAKVERLIYDTEKHSWLVDKTNLPFWHTYQTLRCEEAKHLSVDGFRSSQREDLERDIKKTEELLAKLKMNLAAL